MAHHVHHHQGGCSLGVFRLVLFLMSVFLVGYVLGPPVFLHITGRAGVGVSCPPCICDCPSESMLPLSLGIINNSFADCGKNDPDISEELKKSMIALLSEELDLQKNVTKDSVEHTKASILDARKTSNQYQREAEKCTAGVETCEEAREKAEAELRAERKQSILWERRAREYGWKVFRKTHL